LETQAATVLAVAAFIPEEACNVDHAASRIAGSAVTFLVPMTSRFTTLRSPTVACLLLLLLAIVAAVAAAGQQSPPAENRRSDEPTIRLAPAAGATPAHVEVVGLSASCLDYDQQWPSERPQPGHHPVY
jgi:hypothetical protein